MATCRYCGKGGLFTATDRSGLCTRCGPVVRFSIASQLRVVQDSVRLLETSKNYKTRVGRCETIISRVRSLREYEVRGIPTGLATSTEQLERTATAMLAGALLDGLRDELETAKAKAAVASTLAAKTGALSKVVVDIQTARRQYPQVDSGAFAGIEAEARTLLAREQAASIRDAAERARFKGQKKKALDLYRDLLYLLAHDDVPDAQQQSDFADARAAISELEGELV